MSDESEDEYIYDEEDADDMGFTDNASFDSAGEKDTMGGSGDDEKGSKRESKGDGGGEDRRKSGGSDGATGRLPEEGSYRIVDMTEISDILTAQVDEMVELLDIDYDSALVLLQHFQWGKERMINGYYEDPEKVMVKCGLAVPPAAEAKDEGKSGESNSGGAKAADAKSGGVVVCRICYDEEVKEEDSFALPCGHSFCKDCYGSFLNSAVDAGPQCVDTRCPEHKCQLIVPHGACRSMMSPEMVIKFDKYVMERFIDSNPMLRFCPGPGCNKVAMGSGVTHVECACSLPFCFRCGEEVHDPASCSQLQEWKKKCSNESETANWILANTKKCPKCQARIEKNQGCNHMSCKICKHDFCWICLQEWKDHNNNTGGYYKCNRYVSTAEKGAKQAKAELDRYLHYYQRYHNHNQAMKLAQTQQMPAAEKRMQSMQEAGHDWSEVQYLKHALQQIIICRRVLKCTYVLGYFLPSEREKEKACKDLFEDHQWMLEDKTDKLHELVERPVDGSDKDKAALRKTDVVNLTRVTDKLLKSLLQCMHDGERDTVLTRSLSDGSPMDI